MVIVPQLKTDVADVKNEKYRFLPKFFKNFTSFDRGDPVQISKKLGQNSDIGFAT